MSSSRATREHREDRLCARTSYGLGIPLSKVGFPIRKSTDQSFFAAPHGLSQRSTSFIASQRQGIHQMPLCHLITLILNIHRRSARLDIKLEKPACFKIVPMTRGQAAPTRTPCRQSRRISHAGYVEYAHQPRLSPRPMFGAISSSRCHITRKIEHSRLCETCFPTDSGSVEQSDHR